MERLSHLGNVKGGFDLPCLCQQVEATHTGLAHTHTSPPLHGPTKTTWRGIRMSAAAVAVAAPTTGGVIRETVRLVGRTWTYAISLHTAIERLHDPSAADSLAT